MSTSQQHSSSLRKTTTPAEASLVVAICFGWFIWLSVRDVFTGFPSKPFTNGELLLTLVIELALAATALIVLRVRGFDITTLYPRPSIVGTLQGAGLYLVAVLVVVVVMSPFYTTQPIDDIIAGTILSLPVIVVFSVVNGTFEEVFLLGFLVRGLRGYGLNIAVGTSLFVRFLPHLYQGLLGALTVLIFGLVLTIYFVASDKLWSPVFCHIITDISFFW